MNTNSKNSGIIRHAPAILALLLLFMLVSMTFAGTVKNTRAGDTFQFRIDIPNIGYRGQTIKVYYGYGSVSSYSWDDDDTVKLTFSIDGSYVSDAMIAGIYATAKDGTTAYPMSVSGVGLGKPWVQMSELGLNPAYFNVYAENRLREPVTISIERMYGSSLGVFSVGANDDGYKKLGQATEEDLAQRNPAHFTASWGNSVYDRYTLPFTIDWGAGVGGPGDPNAKSIAAAGGKFIIGAYPPTITGKAVSPASGDSNTRFNFSVSWAMSSGESNTNAAVSEMSVYIDGTKYSMSNTGGNNFAYSTTLSAGTHEYYYSAKWWHGEYKIDTTTQTVAVTQAPPPPSPNFELSPTEQSGECYAGRSTSYTFTAKNSGNLGGVASISVQSQNGWQYAIKDANGTAISSLSLAIGESKSFILNLTAPSSASTGQTDTTTISVGASSAGTVSVSATANTVVQEFPGVSLYLTDDREKKINNGGEEYFSFNVVNEYDQQNNISLSVSSNWNASIVDSNMQTPLSTFNLAVNQSRAFYVKMEAPPLDAQNSATYGGSFSAANITATSVTLGKHAASNVKGVIAVVSNLSLSAVSPASGSQSAKVGEELTYMLRAHNGGNVPEVLDSITASGTRDNWTGKIKLSKDIDGTPIFDTNGANGADLGAALVGGSSELFAKVVIPRDAGDQKSMSMFIKGKGSVGGAEFNITLVATSITPGVEITPDRLDGFCKPGQTASYYIIVNNMQATPDMMEFQYDTTNGSTVGLYDIDDAELGVDENTGAIQDYVGANSQKTVVVKVTPTSSLGVGSSDTVRVYVTSPITGKSDFVTINTTVLPAIGIAAREIDTNTSQNDRTVHFVNITNNGNAADTVNVQYASTLGWNATVALMNGASLSDTNNDSMLDVGLLAPQENMTLKVTVQKPRGVEAGLINTVTLSASTSWSLPEFVQTFPDLARVKKSVNETINSTIRDNGRSEVNLTDTTSTDIAVFSRDSYVMSPDGKLAAFVYNNTTVSINIAVRNTGNANLTSTGDGFDVRFYLSNVSEENLLGTARLYNIPMNSAVNVSLNYTVSLVNASNATIYVVVEQPFEDNMSNNFAVINMSVKYRSSIISAVVEPQAMNYALAAAVGCVFAIGATGAGAALMFRRKELL